MHRSRSLFATTVATALLVASFGAPAAAADTGALAIVNGRPGERVDVCLNGREVGSGLPYGGKVLASFLAGDKVLKIRRASSGRCKGNVLATKVFPLVAGDDISLVVNKNVPKFVEFDNTALGTIPPDGLPHPSAFFAWRHAADLGAVNILYSQAIGPLPAAAPVWEEGDNYSQPITALFRVGIVATRPEQSSIIAASPTVTFAASRRYEFYLLGTSNKNAKIIVFSRKVSQPPV